MGQSKKFLREKEIRKANEYIHGFMDIYAKGKLVDGWIREEEKKSQSMNQCICKAVGGAVLGGLIDRCMNLRVNEWADMGLLWGLKPEKREAQRKAVGLWAVKPQARLRQAKRKAGKS